MIFFLSAAVVFALLIISLDLLWEKIRNWKGEMYLLYFCGFAFFALVYHKFSIYVDGESETANQIFA